MTQLADVFKTRLTLSEAGVELEEKDDDKERQHHRFDGIVGLEDSSKETFHVDESGQGDLEVFLLGNLNGDAIDKIISVMKLADLKNLQQTSRMFQSKVIRHDATWRKRCICIKENNIAEIQDLGLEPLRMWVAAIVFLPIETSELEKLVHILENLEHLEIKVTRESDLSESIRYLFEKCKNLKSIRMDPNVLSLTDKRDFAAIRNVAHQLTHFRFSRKQERVQDTELERKEYKKKTVYGDKFLFKENVKQLTSLNWNLNVLNIYGFYLVMLPLLRNRILNSITHITFSTDRGVWSNVQRIPSLAKVSVIFPHFSERSSEQFADFANFIENQPDLNCLKLRSYTKEPMSTNFLKVLASRSSNLRDLVLMADSFECENGKLFTFLSKLRYLRCLNLVARGANHLQLCDVTMSELLDLFPKTVGSFRLRGFYHGIDGCDGECDDKEVWEKTRTSLESLAKNTLPYFFEGNFRDFYEEMYAEAQQ